jgi:hypothetical protein
MSCVLFDDEHEDSGVSAHASSQKGCTVWCSANALDQCFFLIRIVGGEVEAGSTRHVGH